MHKIFFSSCFNDPVSEPLQIRERVAKLNTKTNRSIWLAEDFNIFKQTELTSPFEIALFCIEGVRNSDAYVAVVRQRHGTGVDFSSTARVQSSYFELELFEAALLRKPAFVFFLKGAEPRERLAGLLHLLSPALPGLCWTPLDEDEILRRIENILNNMELHGRKGQLDKAVASSFQISNRLTGLRYQAYDTARDLPKFEFLGGLRDVSIAKPDLTLIKSLLGRVEDESSHQVRLVILWCAIRELMGADPADKDALALWERALSGWNSSGAWHGLHGHPLMGCLGALCSLAKVQDQLGRSRRPHGSFGSEYYSISKTVSSKLKKSMLTLAPGHVEADLSDNTSSGKLSLRGSILQAMGNYAAAIFDYENALLLRRDAEFALPQQIGETETELGFALVFHGDRKRGLALLEQGVTRLEGGNSTGFLVRAKRKLGRAYLRAGAPLLALSQLAEAYRLAVDIGAYDQVSQIDEIAHHIQRRFKTHFYLR